MEDRDQVERVLWDDSVRYGGERWLRLVERFDEPALIDGIQPTTRPAWRATGTLRQGSNSAHLGPPDY